MSDQIPYLQSERHFHLYEDYLFRVVNNWPQLTVFKPDNLSIETLSTRLRICMNSLRNSQWTTKIPFAKFIQIVDEIVVSTTAVPGAVTCGPYDLIRKKAPLNTPVEVEVTQVVPKVNLVDPDWDLIKAVVVLHHHRLLMEPSRIETKIHPIMDLVKLYDVSIEKVGDVYTIL